MLDGKLLLFYLRKHAEQPWNYMWFDFVNKYPLAITFLQGLNFAKVTKLLIVSGEINDQNVTQKARSLVSRGTALYVVDFKTDFGLNYSNGTFKMEYKYVTDSGNTPIKTLVYPFTSRFDESQFLMTFPRSL